MARNSDRNTRSIQPANLSSTTITNHLLTVGPKMFSVRNGIVEEAYAQKKLRRRMVQKFKRGKRLEVWIGKSSSDLVSKFGKPSSEYGSKMTKTMYFAEKDSSNYWLWIYKNKTKRLAFHVRASDQLVIDAYDQSSLPVEIFDTIFNCIVLQNLDCSIGLNSQQFSLTFGLMQQLF